MGFFSSRFVRSSFVLAAIGVITAATGTGCGSGTPEEPAKPGAVRVSVFGLSEDVTTIEVTIEGPGIDEPIVYHPTLEGGSARGFIHGIPAGPDRLVTIRLYGENGAVLCELADRVEVVAGQMVQVVLTGQCRLVPLDSGAVDLVVNFNFAPRITSLFASRMKIEPGDTVELQAAATDANPDDRLTYVWTSSCGGEFEDASSMSTEWTAPVCPKPCALRLTVIDGKGGETSLDLAMTLEVEKPAIVALSAGSDHSCVLRNTCAIECWGSSDLGALDIPEGLYVGLDVGEGTTCAVREDGAAVCWGYMAQLHQVHEGSFAQVSTDGGELCGLRRDGEIECWGYDEDAPPAGPFVQVAAGAFHVCGLRPDGTVECWGSNRWDQTTAPDDVFVQIAAGRLHTCGLRTDGSVGCWGDDHRAPTDAGYVRLSAGQGYTCGLRGDGTFHCWGYAYVPPPTDGSTFVDLAAGYFHTCGLTAEDEVECWGRDWFRLVDPPSGPFDDVLCSHGGLTCGHRDDGSVTCWADESLQIDPSFVEGVYGRTDGRLSSCGIRDDHTLDCTLSCYAGGCLEPIPEGEFAQVSAEASWACAVRQSGEVTCWGSTIWGTPLDSEGLVPWPEHDRFKSVSVGWVHACGIREDETVACWGSYSGTPPAGPFVELATEQKTCGRRPNGDIECWLPHMTGSSIHPGDFVAVSTEGLGMCGLHSDGTLECWEPPLVNRLPETLPQGKFVDVCMGSYHVCGLRDDGEIACTGGYSLLQPPFAGSP